MSVAAFEQAIAFLGRTDLIAAARLQPLPAGVTEILKVSSGDNEALLVAQEISRYSQEDVRHAAQFYVQQILFAPDSDHYRVLGVDPDDAEAKIKLHYRLLVRWLHPDKNSSDWEAIFSDRINRAWHALRTPERRREYDARLESFESQPQNGFANNLEMKPLHWQHHKEDERFLSSRAIKRLPIVMFSLLGVFAVAALWWFIQLQPRVDAQLMAKVEPEPTITDSSTPSVIAEQAGLVVPEVVAPTQSEIPAVDGLQKNAAQLNQEKIKQEDVNQGFPAVAVVEVKPVARQSPVIQEAKKPILPATKAISEPVAVLVNQPRVENKPFPAKARPEPVLSGTDAKTASTIQTKSRAQIQKPHVAMAVAVPDVVKPEMPVVVDSISTITDPDVIAANRYDTEVKRLLKQFSRFYADGNYFALHNLFTTDLNIIGAPPQRKVLHGYRQLFQTSQHREIAIHNVTWMENDEKITVVADFKSEVLPLGKNEAHTSQGNLRIVLRMENGQLKIIRLQSDAKNG